jgi:hypothetical protein
MRNRLIGIGMMAALGAAGCSTKVCTDIGCLNGFTATAQRADGSFASGTHRVEILADGVTWMCTFTFPLETLPGGGTATPTCPQGLYINVVETSPGHFVEGITLANTPAQVHVWQYVDDAPILDAAAAPTYTESRPNGPECEPVCRQASASWTMQ